MPLWTMHDLFYAPDPATTWQWQEPKPSKPKETNEKPKEVRLRVHICCDACDKQIRKVLIVTKGVQGITLDREANKVTIYGDVKAEDAIKAMAKRHKLASLWEAEKKEKKEKK